MTVCEKSFNSLAIIVAMEGEARPLIKNLNLKQISTSIFNIDPKKNLSLFFGLINEKKVYLIINGKDASYGVDRVGTQFATRVAEIVCEKIQPDLIVSAGTAGGLDDSEIGDVYLSEGEFAYCDRIINLPGTKYPEYGTGHFPSFPMPLAATEAGLKLGKVATSNSLDPTPRDLDELKKLKAKVVDMEAAALAEVAKDYSCPIIAVKSVTNFLDKELHTDFEKNYELAVRNLASKVASLVFFITENSPSQKVTLFPRARL